MTDLNIFLFLLDAILGSALIFYHVIHAEDRIALRVREKAERARHFPGSGPGA